MKAWFALLLVSCGGLVEPTPPPPQPLTFALGQPAYLDDTCAARPAGVALPGLEAVVTIEPGWHYDGSDPKVRVLREPAPSAHACFRVDEGCACRPLEPGEAVYR